MLKYTFSGGYAKIPYILEQGCDLLFMGAFGHRRLVEWVLGSTTQYLLRMSPGPIHDLVG
jgi:nucleotide-binding universal stress UspA family protein